MLLPVFPIFVFLENVGVFALRLRVLLSISCFGVRVLSSDPWVTGEKSLWAADWSDLTVEKEWHRGVWWHDISFVHYSDMHLIIVFVLENSSCLHAGVQALHHSRDQSNKHPILGAITRPCIRPSAQYCVTWALLSPGVNSIWAHHSCWVHYKNISTIYAVKMVNRAHLISKAVKTKELRREWKATNIWEKAKCQ